MTSLIGGKDIYSVSIGTVISALLLIHLPVIFRKNCKSSVGEDSAEEAGSAEASSSSLLLQSMEPCSVVSTPDIHDMMDDSDTRDINGVSPPPFSQPEVTTHMNIVLYLLFCITYLYFFSTVYFNV